VDVYSYLNDCPTLRIYQASYTALKAFRSALNREIVPPTKLVDVPRVERGSSKLSALASTRLAGFKTSQRDQQLLLGTLCIFQPDEG
jgi:hypothetical protein